MHAIFPLSFSDSIVVITLFILCPSMTTCARVLIARHENLESIDIYPILLAKGTTKVRFSRFGSTNITTDHYFDRWRYTVSVTYVTNDSIACFLQRKSNSCAQKSLSKTGRLELAYFFATLPSRRKFCILFSLEPYHVAAMVQHFYYSPE